uniref:Uncharacterized protein n=1 Tax=viral metagenome TaxID=1070528 RepID=A0A6C0CKJ6_9ZZZZ
MPILEELQKLNKHSFVFKDRHECISDNKKRNRKVVLHVDLPTSTYETWIIKSENVKKITLNPRFISIKDLPKCAYHFIKYYSDKNKKDLNVYVFQNRYNYIMMSCTEKV